MDLIIERSSGDKHFISLNISCGIIPVRKLCHNFPFAGNSTLDASSNNVIPKLKISLERQ